MKGLLAMAPPVKALTAALLLMTIVQLMLCVVMTAQAFIHASAEVASSETGCSVPNVLQIRIECLPSPPPLHAWTAAPFHLVRRARPPAACVFATLATPQPAPNVKHATQENTKRQVACKLVRYAQKALSTSSQPCQHHLHASHVWPALCQICSSLCVWPVQLGNTLLQVLRHARRAQLGNTHFQERQHARPARSALLMRCHSKATFLIVWHAQSVIMLGQSSL